MKLKHLFAAGICFAMTLGISPQVFAQYETPTQAQELNPSYKTTINATIIDNNSSAFIDRVRNEVVDKPAPQVGQTRAAIEAIYGPARNDLAPNKNYEVYTNEYELIGGKMFKRNISPGSLKVYEVAFGPNNGIPTANDKASCVQLKVIPSVGDHKNMVTELLGKPMEVPAVDGGERIVYGIPKQRYIYYNDVLSSPFQAINAYFNSDGYMVGQEFMPSRYQGYYAMTSAHRYVEFAGETGQIDRKIGW